ncbi:MAG: hypothetical protein A3F13_05255 [Gammaproteobacteria bacterium RIFCSPHIGHO2_12_FULL_40_19]|nr:MAG: hypothetical protein A3F13_05255 [Gammaproteobacteria bacterium RIFCSPHIGHO2_12_FULL_40_19]
MIARGWNEHQIFLNIAYKTPWFLGDAYPVIIAVGTLMAFSSLAQSNELVVLQAFGFSRIDFIKTILELAVIFALFGFFLISYLSPVGYNLSEKMNMKPAHFQSIWFKQNDNIVYIKKMGCKKLHDIEILELKDTGVKKFYAAKTGISGNSSQLDSVLVKNYNKGVITQKSLQRLIWPNLLPKTNSLRLIPESEKRLNFFQLYQLIKIQKKAGLNAKNYQFHFWKMILSPFLTLMLMLMIMPFAFNENRSTSLMKSIMLGLTIGCVFYFFDQIAFPVIVLLNFPVFLGALIAPVSVAIVCLVYLCLRSRYLVNF